MTPRRSEDHPRDGSDNAGRSTNERRRSPETSPQIPAARLTRDELEFGLKEIIQRLQGPGERAELRIVGGAAISLWHNAARGTTQDIDAVLSPADAILDVAKDVAADQGWPDNWVNDKAQFEEFYPGDDLNDTAYRVLGIALENPERPEIRAPKFE